MTNTKNTKIKYHAKLNHDLVQTRRKSEAKKHRKPMKEKELIHRMRKTVISKARHQRREEKLENETNVYLIIGDGTYHWKEAGIYVDDD